ncbi:MAG: hypothetical protein ACK4Q4_01570 [Rhodocyclaceae bacterium]
MAHTVAERVDRLEEALAKLADAQLANELEWREFKREMRVFKQEMAQFKDEMAQFKDEMAHSRTKCAATSGR